MNQRDYLARLRQLDNKGWIDFDQYEDLKDRLLKSLVQVLAFDSDRLLPSFDPATLTHLRTLRERVLAGENPAPEDQKILEAISRHHPIDREEFHLHQIAHWSRAVYGVNSKFTPLTLRLNVREDKIDGRYNDLRDVVRHVESKHLPALMLLGPPGAGKSTLLRRLGYDLAIGAIRSGSSDARIPFYVELGAFKSTSGGVTPRDWLAAQWNDSAFTHVGSFDSLFAGGHFLFLLDAINEMQCAASEYDDLLRQWSLFLSPEKLPAGNLVVISCRRRDYSYRLTINKETIPHVEVESLDRNQAREFLRLYLKSPGLVATTITALDAEPRQKLYELYNSPFYLTLLVGLVNEDGAVPSGRAELFCAFIRKAMKRELGANPRFARGGPLLTDTDYGRVAESGWTHAHQLPMGTPLFPGLAALAHRMQTHGDRDDLAGHRALRIDVDGARAFLAAYRGGAAAPLANDGVESCLKGAVALHLIDIDGTGQLQFRHQLFQEYFAARKLAADLNDAAPAAAKGLAVSIAQLATQPWRASDIRPTVEELLARLGRAEQLPELTPTGWEETLKLAVAQTVRAAPIVRALAGANLPLAGLCAAQAEVKPRLDAPLLTDLRGQLLARSRDPSADLRARIAAGLALGELGDPRLTPGPLPARGAAVAQALIPEFANIAAGEYPAGVDIKKLAKEDQPHFRNATLSRIRIERSFELACLPVTNAEWARFMADGGYAEPRWWQGDAARAWREGVGTGEADRSYWMRHRAGAIKKDPYIEDWLRDGHDGAYRLANELAALDEAASTVKLNHMFPDHEVKEPEYWKNPAFNSPAQPVVGVCWFEVQAYCAWLSAQYERNGLAVRIRLPTEMEWEAAAGGKGSAGRTYPWGNDWSVVRCNVFDTRLRGTTPVGVFPAGDTPGGNGIGDLAGNTWEWTSTLYGSSINDPNHEREMPDVARDNSGNPLARVVRGGSWYINAVYARVAYRGNSVPGGRDNNLGFRLVRVSHP